MNNPYPDWSLPALTAHLPQEGEGIQQYTIDEREYLVAYEDNQVAAVLKREPMMGFVMPQFRRQGIATAVWTEAVALWDATPPDEADLTEDAIAFYASQEK